MEKRKQKTQKKKMLRAAASLKIWFQMELLLIQQCVRISSGKLVFLIQSHSISRIFLLGTNLLSFVLL